MTYPAPPPPTSGYGAPPPRPGRLRGRTPRRLGWIFLALGVVLIVVGGVIIATKSLTPVNNFQRVKANSSGSVTFKHAGGYVAYYESDAVTGNETAVPLLPVRLTDPNGKQTTLSTKYGNRSDGKIRLLHYEYNDHKGLAMWQFHIDKAGTYKVEVGTNARAAADAQVAFGKSVAGGVAAGAGILGLGVLLLIAAIVLLIVGFVKKRRHKREIAAGQYSGGAQQWSPQTGGQQPWQSPQAQQPWPPQQQPPQQQWPQQQPPPQQGGWPPGNSAG